MFDPAANVTAAWIMMRPVDYAALVVPFVLAVERHRIADMPTDVAFNARSTGRVWCLAFSAAKLTSTPTSLHLDKHQNCTVVALPTFENRPGVHVRITIWQFFPAAEIAAPIVSSRDGSEKPSASSIISGTPP